MRSKYSRANNVTLTLKVLLLVLVASVLVSCETISYYGQAAKGQLSLLLDRKKITRLLEQDSLDEQTRHKLELVLSARDFAEKSLYLPAGKSYLSYVELHRPYVLWNVFAAPEFSTEPVSWCYPIAGCVAYKGFFSEQMANVYGDKLKSDGFEVYSGGVDAYSTLGWFADPLTSSVLRRADHRLLVLLFHELSHQRIYAAGDTTFNESFATFVEQEGLRRWLQEFPQPGLITQIEKEDTMQAQFVALVTEYRGQLAALYEQEIDDTEKRQRKENVQKALQDSYVKLRDDPEKWASYSGYDRWFAGPLNNAQLGTVGSYNDFVPAFAKMLKSVDGDLQQFYSEVDRLAHLPRKQRDEFFIKAGESEN